MSNSKPTVNGIPCEPGRVLGPGGRYIVRFDKADATLEQIEGIDWAHPTLVGTGDSLPSSYGYEVEDRYQYGNFQVHLKVKQECLGDVTAYAAQVSQLQDQLATAQEEKAAAQAQAQTAEEEAAAAQAAATAAQEQAAETAEILDIIVSGEEAAV